MKRISSIFFVVLLLLSSEISLAMKRSANQANILSGEIFDVASAIVALGLIGGLQQFQSSGTTSSEEPPVSISHDPDGTPVLNLNLNETQLQETVTNARRSFITSIQVTASPTVGIRRFEIAKYKKKLYVINDANPEVSVVDLSTNSLEKFSINEKPLLIVACENMLYIACEPNIILAIDVNDRRTSSILQLPCDLNNSVYLKMEASCGKIYLRNDNNIYIIATEKNSTNCIEAYPSIHNPSHITSLVPPQIPFGQYVYSVNYDSADVVVHDLQANEARFIVAGQGPWAMAIGKKQYAINVSTSYLYVANYEDSTVSVINPAINRSIRTIVLPPHSHPRKVLIQGRWLYVEGDFGKDQFLMFDINSNDDKPIASIKAHSLFPIGHLLYLFDGKNELAVFDPRNFIKPIKTFPVSSCSKFLLVGSMMYIADCTAKGGVMVIDTTKNQVVENIETGPYPAHLFGEDGKLYVLTAGDSTLMIIDLEQRGTDH